MFSKTVPWRSGARGRRSGQCDISEAPSLYHHKTERGKMLRLTEEATVLCVCPLSGRGPWQR